jgi:hypothetical protein
MNNCQHEYQRGEWRKETDEETGEVIDRYEYVTYSHFEDVDLHRYKCKQCGELRYYSERAREFYEEGKTEHASILGL